MNVLPPLTIQPAAPKAGQTVKFNFDKSIRDGSPLFVAFFNGITIKYADLNDDNTATIPGILQGSVFAGIVKDKAAFVLDQQLLTGLALFELGFPPSASNTAGN